MPKIYHVAPGSFLEGVKGVIFDCDGVLVDSKDANRMYYNTIRRKLGLLPMTPDEEDFVHAHAVIPSIAHIIPVERLAEAEAARREIDYVEEIMPFTFLEEGLVDLLKDLRTLGLLLAVNTNRTDSMEMLLETFDLTHFFSPVVTAAKVSHPKPNPEGVHRILKDWNLTRHEVAYIGDSGVDEQTARAAGVAFWAYKNPRLAARAHISSFESLRKEFLSDR
ncbi:HAD family hydrolase [Fundidesulfovibrio terrae]|uniref:HAD family hydrolase n=1 Tax=Fundidesulfovibrio terrae TaxID=2922866 RepID=UPI001FB03598|nr:HAD-IA family hydrolase [Fundidesulfovibrio terrae]